MNEHVGCKNTDVIAVNDEREPGKFVAWIGSTDYAKL
jgi:hypothetical protein